MQASAHSSYLTEQTRDSMSCFSIDHCEPVPPEETECHEDGVHAGNVRDHPHPRCQCQCVLCLMANYSQNQRQWCDVSVERWPGLHGYQSRVMPGHLYRDDHQRGPQAIIDVSTISTYLQCKTVY